ncbi:MAG: DNA cytosine methyltransferase, partial [Romboutsia sp.]|nr:DNA cytosine methyltransferase [Romboutsia sp.]
MNNEKISEKIYKAKNKIQRIWCEMKGADNKTVFKKGTKYSYIIDTENKTVKIVPYNEEYHTKGTVSYKKNGEIEIIDICNKKIQALFEDYKQYKITIFEKEIFIEGYIEEKSNINESSKEKTSNILTFKGKETLKKQIIKLPINYYNLLMKASGLDGQLSFFDNIDTKYEYTTEGFSESSTSSIINSNTVKKDKPIITKAIRLLSLFSGIGAFEEAFKNINQPFELVNYCEFQPYIAKSYSLIHDEPESKNLGDITKVNEKNLADFDMMTFGFPCFIAGTKVLTWCGYKNIEDITSEDYVLTHKNRYQRVIKPMINKANHIYRLSTMASDDIYVTGEHPFYVRKKSHIKVKEDGKTKTVRYFDKPEWINAKDLSKDYYVGVAINKESRLPDWNGITITFTDNKKDRQLNNLTKMFNKNDFWWIIGRFIGDGWIRNRYDRKDKNSGIIICCDFNETANIAAKLDSIGVNYSIVTERTVNKFHILNKELGVYCEQFVRGAKNKKITGDIINLPIELLKSFIEGYISADGCYTQGLYKATSTSSELIYGIGQCIAKVYSRPFSVYKINRPKTYIIEGRTVNQNDMYQINFKLEKKPQDRAFFEDGYIWCPINNIEKEEYQGYVYNMEVENDNSYVVQNIIVHNCQDISNLGNKKGFFDENGNQTRS